MDILMPVMGGYESTENIRRIEKEKEEEEKGKGKGCKGERHFICGFSA